MSVESEEQSSPSSAFASMTAAEFQARLGELCERVASEQGRIEVCSGAHTCVLISRAELETLERALEILANTSEVRRVATTIAAMAATAALGPVVCEAPVDAN